MSRENVVTLADAERELVTLIESHEDLSDMTEDEKDDLSWLVNFVYNAHKEWRGKKASEWYPLLVAKVKE